MLTLRPVHRPTLGMRIGTGSALLLAVSSAVIVLRVQRRRKRQQKTRAKQILSQLPRPQVTRKENEPDPQQIIVGDGAQQNPLTKPVYDTSASVPYFKKKLAKYGFGSCGPRGFLGTYTSHLLLEKDLEDYFDQPAIVFSSNATVVVSSIGSVNPDYCVVFENASADIQRLKEQYKCIEIAENAFTSEQFGETLAELARMKLNAWVCFDSTANVPAVLKTA